MWEAQVGTWEMWLSRYPASLKARAAQTNNKTGLEALDKFLWVELPATLQKRKSQHISSTEYAKIVRWKLKRGKWRPRLQGFADATVDAEVTAASQKAFNALSKGNVRPALNELVSLKGCGPATASAILAVAEESVPFMSDELLAASQGAKKYTPTAYMQLVKDSRAKAAELTKQADEHVWTVREVEFAVFAWENYDASVAEAGPATVVKSGGDSKSTRRTPMRKTKADTGRKRGLHVEAQNKNDGKDEAAETGRTSAESKTTGKQKKEASLSVSAADTVTGPRRSKRLRGS